MPRILFYQTRNFLLPVFFFLNINAPQLSKVQPDRLNKAKQSVAFARSESTGNIFHNFLKSQTTHPFFEDPTAAEWREREDVFRAAIKAGHDLSLDIHSC